VSMVRFAHPEFLYALFMIPLLLVLLLAVARRRKIMLERFGNPAMLRSLMPGVSGYRRAFKSAVQLIVLALVILAAANPQIGTKMETAKREGVDIFVLLDVSNSMKAEDFRPNRLENAKRQISLMLDRLKSDRIGIVVFAGDSYLQLPLTGDYSAARLMIAAIDTDIVPVQGTAIGSAIRLARKSFVKGEQKHKVMILISDGENHEDDAVKETREAAKEGIIVHAVGMGSPVGSPIPLGGGFMKDSEGNVVMTRLNEQLLREAASAGKGRYIRATLQQNELDELFEDIEGMEKKQFGVKVFTDYEDRYQYPLGAALLLLVLEFFLPERKSGWMDRWKSWLPKGA
jgi:Ca-activated chloride channel family protein